MTQSSTIPTEVRYSGRGPYYAKERLKQLDGRFNPTTKEWIVPIQYRAQAEAAIAEGRARRQVLDLDPALPNYDRQLQRARWRNENQTADPTVTAPAPLLRRCFECGESRGLDEAYYCGCVEREEARKRLTAKRSPRW